MAGPYGARRTPFSVMMPVMQSAGVTSKAKLKTGTPSGTMRVPPTWVTSRSGRSSMGMCAPSGVRGSMVDRGAAT